MTDLGILKPYDLRQIWQDEDREFTRWLGDNLDRLGAALGMTLERVPGERPIGPFSPGLVARDVLRDRPVIVESQLDPSDHDHLGRLITYASGVDACAVIWVTQTLRDPHRAALDWLNAHTDDDVQFFALVLEAMQIDDSKPALNFKVIASPNAWQKTLLERRDGATEDRDAYFLRFNDALIAALREAATFPQLPAARPKAEIMLYTAHGGIRYGSAFSRSVLRIGLWITFPEQETNRAIFERFRTQKQEIEAALGGIDLDWDYSPDRRGQIVTMNHIGVDREDDSQIPALAAWAAEGFAKMKRVFEPRLERVIAESTNVLRSA